MSEEWISGGPAALAGAQGQPVDEVPGLRVGVCRYEVLTSDRARVFLAGDFPPPSEQGRLLLNAAVQHRWADLTRMRGSYWVFAQHGATAFVCGDVSGFRSIFYAESGPHTVWSTSARQLAGHHSADPDLAMMAARLVAGPEHWPGHTVYQGVSAVPGGFGLLLDDGRRELVDVSGIVPSQSLAGGADAFGQALRRAVHWRMDTAGGPVGADVSGGLDSSSLAILAAEKGPIRAVTYSDAHTSREDLDFARQVAGHIHTPLEVGEGTTAHLPFGWSPTQPATDQPAAAGLTMAQHHLYLRPAKGLPLHFTGNGGDVVLDSCSAAWIGMVQDGERRAARREVTGWARARNRAPSDLWRAVTRAAATGHAGALTDAAAALEEGRFEARRPGVWSWCHLGVSATWLTPEGRTRVAELLRQAAQSSVPVRADLAEQNMSLRLVGADARDTAPLAKSWGIRPVHPFLDNEVVRTAFAIRPAERHGVTTFKPLLAASLPHLPRWLTSRRSKGSFTRQLTAGMRHHEQELAQLISSSGLVHSGLVDPEPALTALSRITGTHAGSLYDLQRLAMSCQWLASHGHRALPRLESAC
jgi:asparagine synthase (glutamine-hydrolysing)